MSDTLVLNLKQHYPIKLLSFPLYIQHNVIYILCGTPAKARGSTRKENPLRRLSKKVGTGNTRSVLSSCTNCQFRTMASGSSGGAAPRTAEDCRGEWKTTAQLKGVRLMAARPL